MKTVVMIPTYNEKDNIKQIINEIMALKIKNLEVVVIDDNSPDGTWKIAHEMSRKNKKVHLLLRKDKRGRGLAGKAGYKWALENKADYIIEMDADFSHQPKDIPKLIEKMGEADLALGSRAIKGGREIGRGIARQIITKMANLYVRILLGIKVKDCNSGFRCFKRKVLEEIDVGKIKSEGPAIVQEVLFKAHLKGFRIKEVPIVFVNRLKGESKLGIKQLAAGYLMVLRLKIQKIVGVI